MPLPLNIIEVICLCTILELFYFFKDTHALMRFLEEDSTSIVPVQRIQQKDALEYGGSCGVMWSNKKVYKAFLICSGSKGLCAEKQDEIDEEVEPEVTANKRHRQDGNGKEDERALNPPKKTKASSGGKVKKAQKTKKGIPRKI